jgi:hypothetical protein
VVVGRANWQFCGSAAGRQTAAVLYSVVGTCKHLGIDPFAYLPEALPALFTLGDSPSEEALADWLPDVWRQRQRGTQASNATDPAALPREAAPSQKESCDPKVKLPAAQGGHGGAGRGHRAGLTV